MLALLGAPTALAAGPPVDVVPGVVALDLDDDLSDADVKSMAAQYGVTLEETSYLSDETRTHRVNVGVGKVQDFINKLRKDHRVEHVEPMTLYYANFMGWTPDDPMLPEQWHMKTVGAERAWMNATGRGVVVAVVDTGVTCEDKNGYKRVSDLANTRCVGGYNFIDDNDFAYDDNGHGTHVAGTIAQSTNNGYGATGLAFQATIMPVKVLSGSGSGTLLGVADGVRFAADNGAHVINMSLGGGGDSDILHDAVKYARDKGVVVVVAAGNNGRYVEYPGAYPESFTVSATNEDNRITDFSSRGPEVDISAPGINVLQQIICNSGRDGCEEFRKLAGTSMATPHVAGAAALIMSTGVTNPDQVETILMSNTSRPGNTLRRIFTGDDQKELYGAGVLNVGKAVTYTVWKQALTRLGLVFLFTIALFKMVRKEERLNVGIAHLGYGLGAAVFGFGLLSLVPMVSSSVTLPMYLLSHPIPEWDMLLGASIHKYLPLATFIVPLGLSTLLYGLKPARPLIAGISVGTAAYMVSVVVLQLVASSTLGLVLYGVWGTFNVAVCLWTAWLNMKK